MPKGPQPHRNYATRDEHRARMQRAENLLVELGFLPVPASRKLAAECGISERQAFRYCRAVRTIYANAAKNVPGSTPEEILALLRTRSVQCIQGEEPDWKASAKFMELEMRALGMLDARTRLTVEGTITHQHVPALEAASEEELQALAAFHAARERRLAAEDAGAPVAGQLPALRPADSQQHAAPAARQDDVGSVDAAMGAARELPAE